MTKDFTNPSEWKEIAATVLKMAKEKGASSAEVGCTANQGFSVNVRLGEVETIEYHRDKSIDVIVFFDHQMGSSSTTDISASSLQNTVDAACSIAKATGGDPCHGLPEVELMARNYPDLDLYYPWEIDVNQAIEIAKACEDHGRQYDARITNSNGAHVNQHAGFYLFANTHDFVGNYFFSRHSISCTLLAEVNNNKE
jgi:PmbA protein